METIATLEFKKTGSFKKNCKILVLEIILKTKPSRKLTSTRYPTKEMFLIWFLVGYQDSPTCPKWTSIIGCSLNEL